MHALRFKGRGVARVAEHDAMLSGHTGERRLDDTGQATVFRDARDRRLGVIEVSQLIGDEFVQAGMNRF